DRWDAVPVVFLTARTNAGIELYQAGADNYVTKPVNGPELLAVLRSRVRRTRTLRPSQQLRAIEALPAAVKREPDVDVVIVDDDEVLVDLLQHATTSRGYTETSIGDGTTAI